MTTNESSAQKPSTSEPHSPDTAPAALAIGFVRGNPSTNDVAAVTAVVGAALEEAAADNARLAAAGPTAWQRSQRAVRTPIHPGHGAWRGFSA